MRRHGSSLVIAASRSLLLSLSMACVLPPDVVAEFAAEASETGGGETGPGCIGDCPCVGESCAQYCVDPNLDSCGFECAPGASCTQTCTTGPCTSECVDAERCDLECLATGACQMACFGTNTCTTQCSHGCSSYCEGSNCEIACLEGDCTLHCRGAESCSITACPFGCTLICEDVAECLLDCPDPTTCTVIMI